VVRRFAPHARTKYVRRAMANAEELAAVPLFESLSDATLRQLAGSFEVRDASEGVRLTGEGAAGYAFYVLTEGSAVVTSDGTTLASLGAGDYFGEIAILDGGRRTATVTTTSPSRLLVLFGTEFRRLQQPQPEIAAVIEETMRRRLAADGSS
jgi:CRP/FNR family transcriptional regulator, cyclic AMP receptor protein